MTNEHCFKQRPTCSVFLCDLCNLYNHILTERLRSFKCYSFSYIRENKALISLQFSQSFGKYPDRNSIWVSEKVFLHHIMNPMCTVYRKRNWILTCKHYHLSAMHGYFGVLTVNTTRFTDDEDDVEVLNFWVKGDCMRDQFLIKKNEHIIIVLLIV